MVYSITSENMEGIEFSQADLRAEDEMDFSLTSGKMEYSFTSDRTTSSSSHAMQYSVTSGKTVRTDDTVLGMDISVSSEDELTQCFRSMGISGGESIGGDSAISKQLEYCVRRARATSTRLAMIAEEMGGLQNDD
jgi:hypothetical protein